MSLFSHMSESQLNQNLTRLGKRFKRDVLVSIRAVARDPHSCGGKGKAHCPEVVEDILWATKGNQKRYGYRCPQYIVDRTIRAMAVYGRLDGWLLKPSVGFVFNEPTRNCARTRKYHALLHELCQLERDDAHQELLQDYILGVAA